MIKKVCEKCGKIIEGYTEKHAEQLMDMHMLKHKHEESRNKKPKKDE